MAKIILIICLAVMIPCTVRAESSYFRGTRTGWQLTQQVFLDGRYKEHNLFIVIGAEPTTKALRTITGWKSRSTYREDLTNGAHTFSEQLSKSVSSVPDNGSSLGKSAFDLFVDPVDEFSNFSLITPATVIGKTVWNALRIGWHGTMLVVEPVVRVSGGVLALVGSPFIKPATYTGVFLAYTGTAVYGYSSSTVAGAVMTAADGTVLALDVATTPVIAAYDALQPVADPVKTAEVTVRDVLALQPAPADQVSSCAGHDKNQFPVLTVISPIRIWGADMLNPVTVIK